MNQDQQVWGKVSVYWIHFFIDCHIV